EMAWEDRTPFEAIYFQFGLTEKDVIAFMRANSKPSSFKMWRKRMQGRSTKHSSLRVSGIDRFKCTRQKTISMNKISKR
ncbi:MAG: TIGR03643 family protein, partial [Sediminibacterium sp.]